MLHVRICAGGVGSTGVPTATKGYFDAGIGPIWHWVESRINDLQMLVSVIVSAPGTFSATC